MVRFIQLSDLHIRSGEREENTNCRKVVQFLLTHYSNGQKPVILLTGDIVDDGKAVQYRNAVSLLRPLVQAGFSMFACPGNHDYGPWGSFYTEYSQAMFQEYILADLLQMREAQKPGIKMEDLYPQVHRVGEVVFIGLDSVVGNEDQFLHFASGEVGQEQRLRLASVLNDYRKYKKVVYFHHHPFHRLIGRQMDDADRVMGLLSNQADFVCFGHKHVAELWPARDDIDWIIAADKTTERNNRYKFQFCEATINGEDSWVSTVTFKRD